MISLILSDRVQSNYLPFRTIIWASKSIMNSLNCQLMSVQIQFLLISPHDAMLRSPPPPQMRISMHCESFQLLRNNSLPKSSWALRQRSPIKIFLFNKSTSTAEAQRPNAGRSKRKYKKQIKIQFRLPANSQVL